MILDDLRMYHTENGYIFELTQKYLILIEQMYVFKHGL